jgi:hypothetical protein
LDRAKRLVRRQRHKRLRTHHLLRLESLVELTARSGNFHVPVMHGGFKNVFGRYGLEAIPFSGRFLGGRMSHKEDGSGYLLFFGITQNLDAMDERVIKQEKLVADRHSAEGALAGVAKGIDRGVVEFEIVEGTVHGKTDAEELGPGRKGIAREKAGVLEALFAKIIDMRKPAVLGDAGQQAPSRKTDLAVFEALGEERTIVFEFHKADGDASGKVARGGETQTWLD